MGQILNGSSHINFSIGITNIQVDCVDAPLPKQKTLVLRACTPIDMGSVSMSFFGHQQDEFSVPLQQILVKTNDNFDLKVKVIRQFFRDFGVIQFGLNQFLECSG
jgi:hypothetical protein